MPKHDEIMNAVYPHGPVKMHFGLLFKLIHAPFNPRRYDIECSNPLSHLFGILHDRLLHIAINFDRLGNLTTGIPWLSLPSSRKQMSHIKPRQRVSFSIDNNLVQRQEIRG